MQYKFSKYTTSDNELKEISFAWFCLSLAFAILFTGKLTLSSDFIASFIFAGISVGLSFIFHELAHKIVAQRYGCIAEFRAFREMLLFTILLSFFGIIFAAPGAVIISGYVNRIANGKIASAGPLTNIFLSGFFMLIYLFYGGGFIAELLKYCIYINALLAVFNLIPLALFDGAKIFYWDKKIWGIMMFCAGILMIVSGMI